MPRSKNRVASRERRKKILKAASGYYGRRKSNLRLAKEAVDRGRSFSYTHRRDKKGDFRSLWIIRINAAVREHDLSYSQFMGLLAKSELDYNRKLLADLAMNDPQAFGAIVEQLKAA